MYGDTKKNWVLFISSFFLSTSILYSNNEQEKELINLVRQPWRVIQQNVTNAVVQVFAQIAEQDLLQPFRIPAHYNVRGSGFFINKQGYLITNAHVVNQSLVIWVQIPALGKRLLETHLVGICPDQDLAVLKLSNESMNIVHQEIGELPFLEFGDSDHIYRSDEVLALGYPLGQESLKSSTGVISGRQQGLIQMSAPINPGSSGGPLLNINGKVIGITSSGILEAQNVGYSIPINDLKVILDDLCEHKLLRKPFLGIVSINTTQSTVEFLGNPEPGGCYVADVIKDSPLDKAGVKAGDMIYKINNHPVDIYGEIKLPISEDKLSITDYAARLKRGQVVGFLIYRNGEKIEISIQFEETEPFAIHKIYPGYEKLEYEIFGGMVVMPLTLNHIGLFANQAPGLSRYTAMEQQQEPALIITHIFPNSELFKARILSPGSIINEINGEPAKTLDEFKNALLKSKKTGFLTVKSFDLITKATDNVLVVLPFKKLLQEEVFLSQHFGYTFSPVVQKLFEE